MKHVHIWIRIIVGKHVKLSFDTSNKLAIIPPISGLIHLLFRFWSDLNKEYTVASLFLGIILVWTTRVGMVMKAAYNISSAASVKNEKKMSFMPNTFLDILDTNKYDAVQDKANMKCPKIIMCLYSIYLSQTLYKSAPIEAVQIDINVKKAMVLLLNSSSSIIK